MSARPADWFSPQGIMRLLKVRSECHLAHATGAEVFSRELRKAILFQSLAT